MGSLVTTTNVDWFDGLVIFGVSLFQFQEKISEATLRESNSVI